MTDAVTRTLRHWRSTCLVYGQSDCMLSIGDHIAAQGGKDVASSYRGTYDDEAGAMAHLSRAGGAAALVDATGLTEIDPADAVRGSIVVVDIAGDGIGGLCTGDGIALRLERGVVEVSRRFVTVSKAWSCPL